MVNSLSWSVYQLPFFFAFLKLKKRSKLFFFLLITCSCELAAQPALIILQDLDAVETPEQKLKINLPEPDLHIFKDVFNGHSYSQLYNDYFLDFIECFGEQNAVSEIIFPPYTDIQVIKNKGYTYPRQLENQLRSTARVFYELHAQTKVNLDGSTERIILLCYQKSNGDYSCLIKNLLNL